MATPPRPRNEPPPGGADDSRSIDLRAALGAAGTPLATRRRLDGLAERGRWVHHVADLDSGEVRTTALDRPLTPLSRAERLSRLGHRFDPSVFGGPSYRLTPQRPYQASPEAWVEVSRPTYYASGTGGDLLWWEPPRDYDYRSVFLGLEMYFGSTPDRRSVASLSLSGHSYAGTVGHLMITAQLVPTPVYVPVDSSFGVHTVDFSFVPPQRSVWIVMGLLPGIELLTFTGVGFGPQPPVFDPGELVAHG